MWLVGGYDAVQNVAGEAPQLLPLVRACFDYPAETFKRKWIDPRISGTLDRLVEFGVLERVAAGGADANSLYRFVDRDGVRRAIAELTTAVR